MKKIFIVLLLLFLVGCNQTTTTELIEETTLELNQNILIPEVVKVNNSLYITPIQNISGYHMLIEDVTPIQSDLLLPNQELNFSTVSVEFDLEELTHNRVYRISVSTVIESSISEAFVMDDIEVYDELEDIEVTYNLTNTDGLYIHNKEVAQVYYIDEFAGKISNENYSYADGKLIFNQSYLLTSYETYDDYYNLDVYTSQGTFRISVNFSNITKPHIISEHEVVFNSNDLEFVFDYCGGVLVDIDGSDLSIDDYTLTNNILVIDAAFIQNLFDVSPDRNNVIICYQLRNDTDIVIGYLKISRSE